MSHPGLTSGTDLLADAAWKHFDKVLHGPLMRRNEPLADLEWSPAITVRPNGHTLVIVETSETIPPTMFDRRRSRMEKYPVPVRAVCVCPEEEFLRKQEEFKDMNAAGYGVITVDGQGDCHVRCEGVPIQQIIHRELFDDELRGLPKGVRQRLVEAFTKYAHSPPSGVADVTEVMEGVIVKAVGAAKRKGWLTGNEARGDIAKLLINMQDKKKPDSDQKQFGPALAAIGSAQGYMSQWRNASHHFPKNAKAAAKKYRDCRHGFIEGIKQINNFRTAMGNLGLTFRL